MGAALARLNDALQGARAVPRGTGSQELTVHGAARSLDMVWSSASAVGSLVAEPSRIVRAVYPWQPAVWPVPGKTEAEVLADCRCLMAAMDAPTNVWRPDLNRLAALKQAEAALLALASRHSAPLAPTPATTHKRRSKQPTRREPGHE